MPDHRPVASLLSAPWAIDPPKLDEIRAVYAAHLRGDVPDIAAIEARLGRTLASEQQAYTVDVNGVATLHVDGVMAPKANLFMQVSGGTSTQLLAQQFASMEADARVRSAVIVWDSPGGNVQAVPAAAGALRSLADAKPTVSLVSGLMASAAYWVGSAANAVMLEGPTDVVGSLGVVQRITWDEAAPNSTELVRGKYKRASVNGAAPSAEFMADAEARIDYLYSELIDAVARHRGVSADLVLQHMADGRLFTGRQAVQSGLADGFATLAELSERMASKPDTYRSRRKARIAAAAAPTEGARMEPDATPASAVTRDTLERDHPALFAALRAEFVAAGATAERARIQAVRAQSMPGHEKLIDTLAFDGKTTGPEAAVAVLNAEREARAAFARDLAADTPAPLPANASATGEGGPASAEAAAAAEAAKPNPMQAAHELAARIHARQAEARAAGRNLSAVEALALITKEQ